MFVVSTTKVSFLKNQRNSKHLGLGDDLNHGFDPVPVLLVEPD